MEHLHYLTTPTVLFLCHHATSRDVGLRPNLDLTFQGHHHAHALTRLDERNTMETELCRELQLSYSSKVIREEGDDSDPGRNERRPGEPS